MKKNLLVLAALSVVALPFLFSCGKPNDPDKPAETVVMQDPPTKDAAIKIEFHEDKPLPKYVDNEGEYEVLSIEFTESNRYIIKRRIIGTKAKVGDIQIVVGSYTENNGNYNCAGFGSVNVSGSGSNANVNVKPEGEENKGNEFNGNANVKDTPEGSSQDQKNADRNWKINTTTLEVVGSDGVRFSHDFNGCDLYEMATYAVKNKANIDPSKFVGYNVVEFIFTGNGTFAIKFTGPNAPAIEGTYKINESSKTINFTLQGDNPFFSGSIPGTYEYSVDKKMTLVLNASIKGYNGSMTFIMSQN